MKTISNVTVGDPKVSPSLPAHVPGVKKGNAMGSKGHQDLRPRGSSYQATMRRSTGINASKRAPIDPRMPVLTPA